MKRKLLCMVLTLIVALSMTTTTFAGTDSIYQGKTPVPASSNNYVAYSMQDGKYISLVRDININYAESHYQTAWLLDADGNVLKSGGRYAFYTHLATDKVIAYGPLKTSFNTSYIQETEQTYTGAYLIDLKNNKTTKLSIPNYSYVYEAAGNGLARVRTTKARSAGEYRFINTSGKTVISSKEYRYCSDFYKVNGKYYYYTIEKNGVNLTKRDSSGKAVKSVKINLGNLYYHQYGAHIYNINGTRVIITETGNIYDLNLKKTTIDELDFFNNCGYILSHTEGDYCRQTDGLTEIEFEYTPSLEIGWKKLHPVVAPELVVSMDACDYNNWNICEGRWTWLSNNRDEVKILKNNMFSHGESYFQDFAFEKVGSKYRIWSLAGSAQYTSTENGPLALGKATNTKKQLFTIVDNGDGTISIKDYKGRYLTCEGTTKESRTTFKAYTGNPDQKFTIEDHESLTSEMVIGTNW